MSGVKSSLKRKRKKDNTLKIGSSIEVQFVGEEKLKFIITEPNKGSPSDGFISCDTPLAKALINTKEGEEVSFDVGDKKCKVILIRKSDSL